MCSDSQQPKMFMNPMSVGSSGQTSTPLQYPSSAQPTTSAPPTGAATVAPPTPPPPTPAVPAVPNNGAPSLGGGVTISNPIIAKLLASRRGS